MVCPHGDPFLLCPADPGRRQPLAGRAGGLRGVKIYEYTPGFIHSKMFVSDDQVAIVGTANMDYRSFYLHFECGVSFYQSTMAAKVRDDILRTLKVCQPVELDELNRAPLHHRAFTKLLRLMAPLM